MTDFTYGSGSFLSTTFTSPVAGTDDVISAENLADFTIDGNGGHDSVTTGNGNDSITTGTGDDTIVGGEGNNTVTAGDGTNAVTTGSGNDSVTTGSGNDVIVAGDGNNTVNAGDGTNTVTTGSGLDTITTGSGADNIVSGAGDDVVTAGSGNDVIDSGADNDLVTAGDGNDQVTAGDGTDTVMGGGGDDTLMGGAGLNILSGGSGADKFVIDALSDDTISDFSGAAGDVIDLSAFATITSFADVLALATEASGSITIALPGSSNLVLVGVAIADLTASDFGFANSPPAVTATGSTTAFTEGDGATAIDSALTVSDADTATLSSATVAITGNFVSGEDILAFTNDGSTMGNISASYVAGTGILTLASAGASATVAEWQTALRAVTYANVSEDPSATDRTVSFIVNDGTNNSSADTQTISVAAINDPSTLSGLVLDIAATEDLAGNLDLSASSFADVDSAGDITVTLTAGSGTMTATGSGGVAITGSGTDTLGLVGTVDEINSYLDTVSQVQYTGAANVNGNDATTVAIIANDGDGSGNVALGTVNIDIAAVNDAPTGTGNTVTMNEDGALALAVLDFGFTDVDSGDTLASVRIDTLTLTSGSFRLSGSNVSASDVISVADISAGNLVYTPAGNANGDGLLNLTFSVNDGTVFAAAPSSFTVNVTPVSDNRAPRDLALSNLSVDEETNGASVGTVSATDPEGGTITFRASDDRFEIVDGTLKLKAGQSLDFETEPTVLIAIRATDTQGVSSSQNFTLQVNDLIEPIVATGTAGSDTLVGEGGNDQLSGAGGDDLIQGAAGNDILRGGNGNDRISGDADNDVLYGNAGDDTLEGNSNDDLLNGGTGNDLIVGGDANDSVDDSNSTPAGSDTLIGGGGNDHIVGGSYNTDTGAAVGTGGGENLIWAGAGNDTVSGDDAGDTIGGGAGNDDIDAGAGNDLIFGSTGNDTINGGANDDTLFGGEDDDMVDGGLGDDIIWAGAGDDTLTGGAGADQFIFGDMSGNDTVTDFDAGEDILDLQYASTDFAALADVQAASTETTQNAQSGLLIDLGDGDFVFLIGMGISDLTTGNVTI
ncbi:MULTISPECIES: beta strand repeat-containing protein [Kordiimonas]|jgi:Ca2+-binding RTX toxin-like protein|uniref:beta strand repeat-containing protein n=1 Tax=Kordiimonas TaxID=288021 RepID=UPI00257D4884|nr:Ig-like domain-containing protein [Kordiimonas sp. UBA4487]